MNTNGSLIQSLGAALRGVMATVAGIALALAGLVFMLFALAVGLVTAVTLVAWALMRGRRPQGIRFGMPPGGRFGGARGSRGAAPWPRPRRGEVIDVEVRDVTPPGAGAP